MLQETLRVMTDFRTGNLLAVRLLCESSGLECMVLDLGLTDSMDEPQDTFAQAGALQASAAFV